ncbi:unnamed protein product [Colias eurytheme]|nr:unnamed protein product [Colias eurytheme]
MESIKKSMEDMTNNFNKRMEEFQRDLTNNQNPPATSSPTSRLAADFETFRNFVITSLQCLQSQINMLAKLLDQQEMRSRKKFLLFHGVMENNKEDLSTIVTDIVSQKLNITTMNKGALSRCNRLGHVTGVKPRPILVKFHDSQIRDSVWFAKTRLKNTGITLSEFLTKSRHEAFMAARDRFGIPHCWTRDGFIFIAAQDGSKHRIACISDLDAIPTCPDAPVNPREQAASGRDTQKDAKAIPAARSKRLQKVK